MKIGIDCRMYSASFTGIGRYTYELVKNLSEIDTQNEYFLFFNEPEYSAFKPYNERFHKVLVDARHYSVKEQTRFLTVLNEAGLDLMHFTHFNAPILYRGRCIVTIHDLTLSYFPGKKMNGWLHRAGYNAVLKSIVNKSQTIIAVSENTKKDLIKLLHTPEEKIRVIYEGVGDEFKPVTSEHLLTSVQQKYQLPERFLLYTGVWRSHKNVLGLLKAFSILKTEHRYPGKLVLTGKKSQDYPEITQMITDLDLESEIVFTGLVPEAHLITLLTLAEVFVFPSFYEGFGLPPLEAFACKTPVAASNAACIPEICGEGNASFFDPHNPNDMAKKIQQIVTQPELKEKLIANGFKRSQFFSWKKMATEILSLYQ